MLAYFFYQIQIAVLLQIICLNINACMFIPTFGFPPVDLGPTTWLCRAVFPVGSGFSLASFGEHSMQRLKKQIACFGKSDFFMRPS